MDKTLDCNLHHPLAHKLAVVFIKVLSLGQEALEEESAHETKALLKNGYCSWVVCQFSTPHEKATGRVKEQPRVMIFLPYVYSTSESLKKVSKPFRVKTVMEPIQWKLVHPRHVVTDIHAEIKRSIPHPLCRLSCHKYRSDEKETWEEHR